MIATIDMKNFYYKVFATLFYRKFSLTSNTLYILCLMCPDSLNVGGVFILINLNKISLRPI